MRFTFSALIALLVLIFANAIPATAGPAQLGAGSKIEALPVGATTYRQVEIRSVNARTAIITHAGGMCSVALRELSPEWQKQFGYDPTLEAAATATSPPAKTEPPRAPPRSSRDVGGLKDSSVLQQFGQPAAIQSSVDLRPRMFALKLSVKNQGRRPSCAIFALVSALEFQNAEVKGEPEKFSEEYLSWATRKITRRPVDTEAAGGLPTDVDADEGFTLGEVVSALRAYGIPLQSSMPNKIGRSLASIDEPPPAVVAEAQAHERVFVYTLPGHDNFTRINNAVHVLNSGRPVVIGLGWPSYRTLRMAFLADQTPLTGKGHAVALVGYTSATGRLEDAVFYFKNSWGANWGQGGYGAVTFSYLNKHLQDTLVLELAR